MQLRSLITLSAAQSLTLRKAARMRFKAGFCKRVANRDVGCRFFCVKIERKLVRKLVRKFARKFARKFGHKNFATKRFGKFSPQKIHPNLRLCSGTLLGNERRRPKSEMLGFSQPGSARRRFRTTMSAHASKPSSFLCVSLWRQGCFRNLFVKVYRWMGKTEVIMVAFAEDNASNRSRNIFDPKNPQGPLWEIGSANLRCSELMRGRATSSLKATRLCLSHRLLLLLFFPSKCSFELLF